MSQPPARDYFEIAHGTFLWRIVRHPRGDVRDTGLLHARIPDADALLSHSQHGASWEGMVVEEILRQLNALGAGYDYSYYRTGGGAEVDLVLEGDFGRVGVEIKHASAVNAREVRGLSELVKEHHARLGIVITNDVAPRHYDGKLFGVPFSWL